jgi:hypothetical protein
MSKVTQPQIDAFLKTLKTWAKSLPKDEQAMLGQLLLRTKSGGPLSEEQLEHVAGGLRIEEGWMQWASRQY